MQWPKAKNLIILLLIAVNVLLLWQILSYNTSTRYISREFAEKSADALRDAELYVDSENIPLEIPKIPTLVYSFSVADYEHFVERIFGRSVRELESNVLLDDGRIVGAYYKDESGVFNLYFDGSFLYSANVENETAGTSTAAANSLALAFAGLAGVEREQFVVSGTEESEGGFTVTLSQLAGGISVSGYGIEVQTVGKTVKSAQGRLLLVQKDRLEERGLGSAVDALFKISATADMRITVESMSLCYYPAADNELGSFSATCTPAYRLDTDKGVIFYLLTSGQIYWE